MDADDLFEQYEERAAIMQFDGGLTREEAEDAAMTIVTGEPAS